MGFLDVDHRAGLGHGDYEVGLARQEGRQLDDVAHLGDHGSLLRLVDVGYDRHAEGLLDVLEDPHAFFKARAAIGGHGRTVGLVEAGLEDIRDTQFLGDPHVLLTYLHRHVAAFQHVHAAKQHHGLVVGNLDVAYANDLLGHQVYAFF